MLDTCRELLHYLGASQLPMELEGSLTYNHEDWMAAQEVLEKTEAELLALLTEYEQLQEIMEQYELPSNLSTAKDALQLHNEHSKLIQESRLSQMCDRCQEVIKKLRQPALHPYAFSPSKHPDLKASMVRLESHMGNLYAECGLLVTEWKEKDHRLQECLQLRQLEWEYHSHLNWLEQNGKRFLREHMDIGDSYEAAMNLLQQWNEFHENVNLIGQQICATMVMGNELQTANHHASEQIKELTTDLSSRWEGFCYLLQERVGILECSVNFQGKLQTFLRQLKAWLDKCGSHELSDIVEGCEQCISSHEEMREAYQSAYGLAMKDGQQLREGLMQSMNTSQGNTPSHSSLSVHLQRVQATIDDTTEQLHHLDREWMTRSHELHCQLNLCSFRRESEQVILWVQQTGNVFLAGTNSIGSDATESAQILGQVNKFEEQAAEIYNTCTQLLSWAEQMDENGSCWPDLIHQETEALESVVQDFVTRLDQCRETVMVATDYHSLTNELWREWAGLQKQLNSEQFADSVDGCHDQLHQLKQRWHGNKQAANHVFAKASELLERLQLDLGVDYQKAREQVDQRVIQLREQQQLAEKVWQWRQFCLEAWLAVHQFAVDVSMYLDRSSSWLEQMVLNNLDTIQSFVDAQMKLDGFSRQQTQIQAAHNELIMKSEEVVSQLEQYGCLDTIVYNHTSARDHVKQLVAELEALLLEVHTQGRTVERSLQDCLQFYNYYQKVEECSISIGQCTGTIEPISAVGHSVTMAERLLEQSQRTGDQMKAIHEALEDYEEQLKEFVAKKHFRYDRMQVAFTAAQTRWLETYDRLIIKLQLSEVAISFYGNVKKVDVMLDNAQRVFASKDSPDSVEDCEQSLSAHEQLLNDVKQGCKRLKVEGNSLCNQLSPWLPPKSKPLPATEEVSVYCTPPQRRDGTKLRHAIDHLDVAGSKEQTSVDHVNQTLMGIDLREAHCIELFSLQCDRLRQIARMMKFETAVHEVIQWVEETGSAHVAISASVQSSSEQGAQELLQQHRMFMENDATLKNGVVQNIREEAHSIMDESPGNRPQIKLLLGELDAVWGRFERNLSTTEEQLLVVLEFQEKMAEANTWCLATRKLLSNLEATMSSCESSKEVQQIISELGIYTTSTKLEHNTRVIRVKELASKLKWSNLSDLAYQVEGLTNSYIQRMVSLKAQLQEQARKLVLIEQEMDKRQRMLKQKERVLEELVSTEKLYVSDMRTVMETYLLHYGNITMVEGVANKQGIVFANLESISNFHSNTFLPQLERAIALGGVNSVAELFLQQAEKLATLYVSYCLGKTASEQLIVTNISFFNELQEYVGLDLPLSSYLIKPVQRITKYPLLLKEALRYCSQLEEAGCDALNLACQQLAQIVLRTNDAVHLSSIEGFDEPLVELGTLLYQGPLILSERGWRAHEKERQLFLFDLGFLLCRRQELGLGRVKYVFKQKIMASEIQVSEPQDDPLKFLLVVKGDQKFLFKVTTKDERDTWVEQITLMMHQLDTFKETDTLKRASLRSSSRRNAVTITRSSSMSPTPVVIDSSVNSRGSSPTQYLDSPSLSRNNSVTSHSSNTLSRGSPILSRQSHTPKRGSPTLSRRSPTPTKELENDSHFTPLQRTTSALSTNSYSSTSSHNSSTGQITTGSPNSMQHSKSSVQSNKSANQDTTDQGPGSTQAAQKYMVLKDYDPGITSRGIKLKRDQSIEILHKGEIDHWFGRTSSGQVGWIPKEIVEVSEQQASPRTNSKRHGAIRRRRGSASGGLKPATSNTSIASMTSLEDEDEKRKVGAEKMMFVLQELLKTEKEYMDKMNDVIKDYLPEMSNADLPESLTYKERIVFGNIEELYVFHSKTFLPALTSHDLKSPDIHETIATCFLDNAGSFEMYVKYCENKPRSEALLSTPAGSHFDGVQLQLGQKEDISSLLIRPVQRITKYQLLLGQFLKIAEKYGLLCVQVEKAVELMTEVPKRANDKMKLSMIEEYPGNIHANGDLLMCDDFTVFEKAHRHGVSRRVFLLESKMVITKLLEDGRSLYRDALNMHNLTLTESLTENPSKFAVGSGSTGNWERYYIMEAPSAEIKEEWMECIKKILLKDLEMMKALLQGGSGVETSTKAPQATIWSDSDDEFQLYQPPTSKMVDVKKETAPANRELYIVTEDCAPPTDDEGILYLKCGQVYEVINKVTDWWKARLVLDMVNPELVGREGWVAPSFLNHYTGNLEEEQELQPQQRLRAVSTSILPDRNHGHSKGMKKMKLRRGMLSFSSKSATNRAPTSNGNKIFSEELSDISCTVGSSAKFRCCLAVESANVKVQWLHNGNPVRHKRAFLSEGQVCLFQVKLVELGDAGNYSCHVTIDDKLTVVSSAKLTVMTSPNAPGQPVLVQSAPSLVSLHWEKPLSNGGAIINGYVVTGCDQDSKNPSHVTQWFSQCGGIVRELAIGHVYIFSVKAINKVGESIPSNLSQPVKVPYGTVKKFTTQREYSTGAVIGSGRFSEVCLVLQSGCKLAGKMIKQAMGLTVAQHELDMLMMLSHKNVVALEDAYKTSKHFVIVMNMVEGSNLFSYIVDQDCLTEGMAVDCLHQLLAALCYLHSHYIAHLDIKAENVMVTSKGVVPHITLIDFGSARFIPPTSQVMMDIPSGNIDFVAPEVINNKPVSMATDMWAFGVFTYILLSGTSPFTDTSRMATMKEITSVKYSFPSKQFHAVSSIAKSFISRLLLSDMQSRLSCTEAIQTPWIQGEITRKSSKSQLKLDVSGLKHFTAKRTWQGAKSSYKERRLSKT